MVPSILAAFVMPAIQPEILRIGPIAIRWYALAYVTGLILGWWYARRLAANEALWAPGQRRPRGDEFDDLLVWTALGVVLGGRLGHVLIYGWPYYSAHPLEILQVWKGGMAFHGGFVGVLLAVILYARRAQLSALSIFDLFAVVAPIGLFFGRLANLVNQELWGRVTDVPWGVIFQDAGPLPRHPSQVYEAVMEGLIPFLLLGWMARRLGFRRPGLLAGSFGILYGLARIVSEFFREPDPDSEALAYGLTMGMVLSAPMILAGLILVVRALRRPTDAVAAAGQGA